VHVPDVCESHAMNVGFVGIGIMGERFVAFGIVRAAIRLS
jgi:hypothetical protein